MYICNDCGSINLDDFSDCIHCDNCVTYIHNTVLRNVVGELGIKSEADLLKEVLISIYERGCVSYNFIKRVILTHPRLTDSILLDKFNMKR